MPRKKPQTEIKAARRPTRLRSTSKEADPRRPTAELIGDYDERPRLLGDPIVDLLLNLIAGEGQCSGGRCELLQAPASDLEEGMVDGLDEACSRFPVDGDIRH